MVCRLQTENVPGVLAAWWHPRPFPPPPTAPYAISLLTAPHTPAPNVRRIPSPPPPEVHELPPEASTPSSYPTQGTGAAGLRHRTESAPVATAWCPSSRLPAPAVDRLCTGHLPAPTLCTSTRHSITPDRVVVLSVLTHLTSSRQPVPVPARSRQAQQGAPPHWSVLTARACWGPGGGICSPPPPPPPPGRTRPHGKKPSGCHLLRAACGALGAAHRVDALLQQ